MSSGFITVGFFLVSALVYGIVSFIGNKIVDKGEDAISNVYKRRKNVKEREETENLSDRYRN